MLYKTFRNFISSVVKYDKISNKLQNIYTIVR